MKILITGATGFIGTHVAKHLAPDHEIITWSRCEGSLDNLPADIECVVHLAGAAGGNLETCISSNVVPTAEVLRAMEHARIPRIVFLSGAAVYQDSSEILGENAPLGSTAPYGISKIAAESLIKKWHELGYIKTAIILRGNNIYGLGSDHGVISGFLAQAKNGAITVDGDGSQVREPVYVDDAVSIIQKSIEVTREGVRIYNVSGPRAYTLRDIATEIGLALGKEISFHLSGKLAAPPLALRLSISKAKEELGWTPHSDLGGGLAKIQRA
ncbi:MAG: NAD(P)-dependent oxidoreductase [Candidatus Ryanbacteria bacterium]|nr:NAD(P)-dependent oxidoreductase [Candidatus Ryanbacteria bacterium]